MNFVRVSTVNQTDPPIVVKDEVWHMTDSLLDYVRQQQRIGKLDAVKIVRASGDFRGLLEAKNFVEFRMAELGIR